MSTVHTHSGSPGLVHRGRVVATCVLAGAAFAGTLLAWAPGVLGLGMVRWAHEIGAVVGLVGGLVETTRRHV